LTNRQAGQLVIFDDKPLYWQAWDVEVFHLESRKELVDADRLIVVLIQLLSLICVSVMTLARCGSFSTMQMESEVEWQETMKFLKVEFPVDITNTEASYETQY
jgi:alpha-mannosidase